MPFYDQFVQKVTEYYRNLDTLEQKKIKATALDSAEEIRKNALRLGSIASHEFTDDANKNLIRHEVIRWTAHHMRKYGFIESYEKRRLQERVDARNERPKESTDD